jgi:hypothetical protein
MTLIDEMPHTCTAKRRTRTKSSDGLGYVDTYTTLFSARVCWRQNVSDKDIDAWKARSIGINSKVFFETDPELDENCILEFPSTGPYHYEVRSAAEPDDSVGFGLLWRVMCERVRK